MVLEPECFRLPVVSLGIVPSLKFGFEAREVACTASGLDREPGRSRLCQAALEERQRPVRLAAQHVQVPHFAERLHEVLAFATMLVHLERALLCGDRAIELTEALVTRSCIVERDRVDAPLAHVLHRHDTLEVGESLVVTAANHQAPAKIVQRRGLMVAIGHPARSRKHRLQHRFAVAPVAQPQQHLTVESIDLERDRGVMSREHASLRQRFVTVPKLALIDEQLCHQQSLIRADAVERRAVGDPVVDRAVRRSKVASQDRDLRGQEAESPLPDCVRRAGSTLRAGVRQRLGVREVSAAPHSVAGFVVILIKLQREVATVRKQQETEECDAGRHRQTRRGYGDHMPLVSTSPALAEPPASEPRAMRTIVRRRE